MANNFFKILSFCLLSLLTAVNSKPTMEIQLEKVRCFRTIDKFYAPNSRDYAPLDSKFTASEHIERCVGIIDNKANDRTFIEKHCSIVKKLLKDYKDNSGAQLKKKAIKCVNKFIKDDWSN